MTMKSTMKRALAATAAAAVGAVAAVAVAAAPAQATCLGRTEAIAWQTNANGHFIAWERPIAGTCDGDGIYNGQLRDGRNDGYAARVRYRDGSFNAVVAYASTDTWVNYRFYDQTGNSRAEFQLYSNPATNPSYWQDNWGY
jgi:hypothetical protein